MSHVNQMPFDFDVADSNELYQPYFRIIRAPKMGRIFEEADADIKEPSSYLLLRVQSLEVKGELFPVLIIPQADESFVVRAATNTFRASGQGKTEKEAIQDIKAAIELLLEEEANPSGDVEWPEDCR